MGVAYFIVLDRKIDGLDASMSGKALAAASPALDELAQRLGVSPLSEFISVDPEAMADFLEGEGTEPGGQPLPAMRQFPATAGLATVQALMKYIEANPNAVKDSAWVLNDLKDCQRILEEAARQNVRWHFEVDF